MPRRACTLQEQAAPFGTTVLCELECGRREALGGFIRVERIRTRAGLAERASRGLLDLARVVATGARVFEGLHVMVGEHFRGVLHAAELLDPVRGAFVLLRTAGARELTVRNIAKKDVQERVLGIPFDGGPSFAAHELLSL